MVSKMALIFDIKRYAINDGPGIRTTLFMKGCPLSCVWCHNPEGLSNRKQKLYTRKKCIGCRTCVEACPQKALTWTAGGIVTDPSLCDLCGICVEVCPARAMEISGTEYSIDYLMKEIEKETVFMDRSEGGVTFCGGEPLLHPEMLLELLRRCGELGIHRAVDTTLFARPEIAEVGHEFRIRIPLIEGINADEENIVRSAAFLSSLPWKHRTVNILLYHDIGKNKHEKLGTVYNPDRYPMATPSEETVQRCTELFNRYGIEVVTGG